MILFSTVAAGTLLLFLLAWAWAVKIGNYSIVDAVWAAAIGLAAVTWLALGEGDDLKRAAAGLLIACWSLRLGWHLALRIAKAHPEEDARYRKLREQWAGREKIMFFGFFQIQALSVIVLALPFFFIARDAGGIGAWEIAGTIIAVLAIFGEAVADRQKEQFRKTHERNTVCDAGLWRYSRHPNYFFESLIWAGFYLFACGSSHGWLMIHAPLIILFLLLRVTGVPPSEASSLASKGEAYRAYQHRTSVFLPLPTRNSGHS